MADFSELVMARSFSFFFSPHMILLVPPLDVQLEEGEEWGEEVEYILRQYMQHSKQKLLYSIIFC